eukprot:TRINITY_DN4793_c3_g1_i1.p1 TRINITY_DN4793_c3_g1~~TRINITY_DN4793_c3_g1_i1.p1  ORF type:complete len:291 (+),score=89.28 TRINITY_DN4793_c3_g1_i1:53-925(+)
METQDIKIESPNVVKISAGDKIQSIASILGVTGSNQVDTLKNINNQLETLIKNLPQNYLDKALWHSNLDKSQTSALEEINNALQHEYKGRKEVLLKRFEASAQTFLWSPSLTPEESKDMQNKVNEILSDNVPLGLPEFSVYDILVAKEDILSRAEGTTSKSVSGQRLKAFVMESKPPDRGGRVETSKKTVDVMPTFEDRKGEAHDPGKFQNTTQSAQPSSSSSSRGGRRGGRVQGNWSEKGGNSEDSTSSEDDSGKGRGRGGGRGGRGRGGGRGGGGRGGEKRGASRGRN